MSLSKLHLVSETARFSSDSPHLFSVILPAAAPEVLELLVSKVMIAFLKIYVFSAVTYLMMAGMVCPQKPTLQCLLLARQCLCISLIKFMGAPVRVRSKLA